MHLARSLERACHSSGTAVACTCCFGPGLEVAAAVLRIRAVCVPAEPLPPRPVEVVAELVQARGGRYPAGVMCEASLVPGT